MDNHIFQGQMKCFSSWKELLLLAWMWEDKDTMLQSCKDVKKLSTDNVFDMLLKKKHSVQKLFYIFAIWKVKRRWNAEKEATVKLQPKFLPQKRKNESLSFVLPAGFSYKWCTPLSQLKGKLWAAASSMGSGRCLLQLGSSSFSIDWQRWSCQPLPLDPESLLPASTSTQVLKGSIWPQRWGLPSLPASFWADLKVCIPGLENLPCPKSRLKPTAVFQALPSNPAIRTRARSCTSFATKKSLELLSCSPKHKDNFIYVDFKLYLFVPSTCVFL